MLAAFPTSIGWKQSRNPIYTDPIAGPPSVKEVNDLLTGVLHHPLQLRHSGVGGTKFSMMTYFILRRINFVPSNNALPQMRPLG